MNVQSQSRYSVWGIALVVLGLLFLINQFVPGYGLSHFVNMLAGAGIFGFVAVMAYSAYGRNRHKRWQLVVAYVAGVIAGLIALHALFPRTDDLVGAAVMFAIAAPFLYVFARDRSKWWALIPGGFMGLIGVGLLLDAVSGALPFILIGAGVLVLLSGLGRRGEPVKPVTADGPLAEMMPLGGPQADRPRE